MAAHPNPFQSPETIPSEAGGNDRNRDFKSRTRLVAIQRSASRSEVQGQIEAKKQQRALFLEPEGRLEGVQKPLTIGSTFRIRRRQ